MGGRKLTDLEGRVFGKLIVVEKTYIESLGYFGWLCLCECGSICERSSSDLLNGHLNKSCGCSMYPEKKRFCKRGHERISENLRGRSCKLCEAITEAARYEKEKEKGIRRSADWAKKYPDKANEKNSKWKKKNPEKVRASNLKRKTAKTRAGGSFTADEWNKLCDKYENCCVCCGRKKFELEKLGLMLVPDHITPIAKGGTSNIDNIQPLCHAHKKGSRGGCNNSKIDKIVDYRT